MRPRTNLRAEAYDVADKYRDGYWPALVGRPWPSVWAFLKDELRSRCPGKPDEEYADALQEGFAASR